MWSFVTGFFHLARLFSRFIHAVSVFIPFHGWRFHHRDLPYFMHQLTVSTLWLLCMKLLSSSRSGIAELYGNSMCNILRNFQTIFQSGCTSNIPSSNGWWFQFLYILTNTCGYLTFIFQPPWRGWNGVSLCFRLGISLVKNDAEHLFMYLLAPYICCLQKCLFKSFAHFLTGSLPVYRWAYFSLALEMTLIFYLPLVTFPAYPGPVGFYFHSISYNESCRII